MKRSEYVTHTQKTALNPQEKEKIWLKVHARFHRFGVIERFLHWWSVATTLKVVGAAVVFFVAIANFTQPIINTPQQWIAVVSTPQVVQAWFWWKIITTQWRLSINGKPLSSNDFNAWDRVIVYPRSSLTFVTSQWAQWSIQWPAEFRVIESSDRQKIITIAYAQSISLRSLSRPTPRLILPKSSIIFSGSKKVDIQIVVTPNRQIINNRWDQVIVTSQKWDTPLNTQMTATVTPTTLAIQKISSPAEIVTSKQTFVATASNLTRKDVASFFDALSSWSFDSWFFVSWTIMSGMSIYTPISWSFDTWVVIATGMTTPSWISLWKPSWSSNDLNSIPLLINDTPVTVVSWMILSWESWLPKNISQDKEVLKTEVSAPKKEQVLDPDLYWMLESFASSCSWTILDTIKIRTQTTDKTLIDYLNPYGLPQEFMRRVKSCL